VNHARQQAYDLLFLSYIDEYPVRIGELVLAVPARGDQSQPALSFPGLADDSFAHARIGLAQSRELFFDHVDAFDFETQVF
jgi:hypothetical protein